MVFPFKFLEPMCYMDSYIVILQTNKTNERI